MRVAPPGDGAGDRAGERRPWPAATAAWERVDERRGVSVARWQATDDGWWFHGTEVIVGADTLSCSFAVVLGPDWKTRVAEVTAVSASGENRVHLEVRDGRWAVDGHERPDLAGCVDIDVAATPLTNTFPIRRLAARGARGPVTSPVAWVDVPALTVTRVEQTYTRLPDREGATCWSYADPTHGAFVLTVDDEGIVVDYHGFARRIWPA